MPVVKIRGYKWDVTKEASGVSATQRGGRGLVVNAASLDKLPEAVAHFTAETKGSLRKRKAREKAWRRMPLDYEKLNAWLKSKNPHATALNYAIEGTSYASAEVVITYTLDDIPEGMFLKNYIAHSVRQIRISYAEAESAGILQEDKKQEKATA